MEKKAGFFKRFLPLFIIVGIVAVISLVDIINAKSYDIALISAYTEDNPEGDPNKLYFATADKEETIYLKMQVTKSNQPCVGHSIVGIGQNGGQMIAARQVTDENGYVTFTFACFPVYKKINDLEAQVFFYEESSAYIIEFRVEKTINFTLYKRP